MARKRWRMGWTMARKRALQLSAALAKTRLAIWQRSLLVALCTTTSDKYSTSHWRCRADLGSINCSWSAFRACFDKRAGDTDAGAAGEGSGVASGCHQKEAGRAERVKWSACTLTNTHLSIGHQTDADGFHGCQDGGGQACTGL